MYLQITMSEAAARDPLQKSGGYAKAMPSAGGSRISLEFLFLRGYVCLAQMSSLSIAWSEESGAIQLSSVQTSKDT
jgi:hypothetical protein